MTPSHDLPGLTSGASLRRPNFRPAKVCGRVGDPDDCHQREQPRGLHLEQDGGKPRGHESPTTR
jgi:hypothetical protein